MSRPAAAGGPTKAGERIAKRIARAGLCSRREAETMIAAGRVSVDGHTVASPALDIEANAIVTVDGALLPDAEPARLFRYHKPRDLLTTTKDPQGRATIYDGLPSDLPRLMPIGRLDWGSEGLLLLTNDGELKRKLELPATGWTRRYRVRCWGTIDDAQLARLARGVTVEGVAYGPIEARVDSRQASNVWLTMALKEGKNREVRRVLKHLGLDVNRLIRVAYGPFQLGALDRRGIDEVPRKVLREQLGTSFAATRSPRRRPTPRAAPADA